MPQMRAQRWRTTRVLTNANMTIPAGTVVTIRDKRSGLTLCGEPCFACGVQIYIRRVEPSAVELIHDDDVTTAVRRLAEAVDELVNASTYYVDHDVERDAIVRRVEARNEYNAAFSALRLAAGLDDG